jgi:hypothetical protein
MNQKTREALEKIRRAVADATDPKRLSKKEALEVYEEASADLDGSIDAIKQEIESEE